MHQNVFKWFRFHSRFMIILAIITLIPSCSYPNNLRQNIILMPGIDLQSVYRRLDNAGFNPGPYNESDLTQLSKAIMQFQKVAKLDQSGVLDQKTWKKLKMLYDPEQKKTSTYRKPSPSVKRVTAKHGSATIQLPSGVITLFKEMLKKSGYQISIPDGTMDSDTLKAVRQFQKKQGIKGSGKFDKKTILSLINTSCSKGCYFPFVLNPSDIKSLAALPLSFLKSFSNTTVERVFIKEIQMSLNDLGFDSGISDGRFGPNTSNAIRRFQQKHNIKQDGQLSKKTASSILLEYCDCGCQIVIARGTPKAEPASGHVKNVKKVKLIKPSIIPQNYPVQINDKAYAVEKYECSDISGDWIIFYEGVVTDKRGGEIYLHLKKRFGYRYHPEKEGIDKTDWWCIPKKRHCFSTVKFKDWQGKYFENQVVSFPESRVYNAKIGIINGISEFLKQHCNRR